MPTSASSQPRMRLMVGLAVLGLWSSNLAAQVVLNEVLADNRTAVPNGSSFPDYIELLNPTAQPVDITGWSLTDDPLLPQKFAFPPGTSLPAHGLLIVWAAVNTGDPGLHTGFGLGAKGDLVRLYAANGTLLQDEIVFGLQAGDYSLGRVPDGAGTWMLNQPSAGQPNVATPLTSATELRVNEWMARPTTGQDWLEIFNAGTRPVALGGLVITDQPSGTPGNRAIPANSFIAPRGFIQFFASDLAQLDADHLDFKLASEDETLTIYAADRSTILNQLVYGSQAQNVSQGRAPDGSNAINSFPAGSSPGAANVQWLTSVAVSEVLTHTDPPYEDAIELCNLTATPVDISHWWLSDSAAQLRKYRIPAATILPANGFKVFYHVQFGAGATGFALNSVEGDAVFLSAGDVNGNLTGGQTYVSFGAALNGIPFGRQVTSTGVDFVPLSQRTFGVTNPATVVQFRQGTGQSNAAPRVGPVVINELMFSPTNLPGLAAAEAEFIELHNPTALPATLYDPLHPTNTWRLRHGVTFDCPQNITLPAGGFLLVVSFNPVTEPAKLAAFRAAYSVPTNVPVTGPYSGSLSDTGTFIETLEPDQPEGPLAERPGFVPYMQTERIAYSSTAPWPANTTGTGLSLQRRAALAYGNDPSNWHASLASPGRTNTADTDGDGMSDSWEFQHGLNGRSPADATTDPDQDGVGNRDEFRAGTDPTDAASVFAFTEVRQEGHSVRLRFHSAPAHSYTLESSPLATSGSWQTITQIPPAVVIGPREVLTPAPTNSSSLYRLLTPVAP